MRRWEKWAFWALALVPVLLMGMVYPLLPDIVPTKWDFTGTIRAYGSKQTLWVFAGMGPLFSALFSFYYRFDPRNQKKVRYGKHFGLYIWGLTAFLSVLIGTMALEILRPGTVQITRVIMVMVGLLIAGTGNMMPTVRSNFSMGIRTPWTMSSDENWASTHRLAGRMWFSCGLLLSLAALVIPLDFMLPLFMLSMLSLAVVPSAYSFLLYQKENGKGEKN